MRHPQPPPRGQLPLLGAHLRVDCADAAQVRLARVLTRTWLGLFGVAVLVLEAAAAGLEMAGLV
jgi:hypothetical protein